MDTTGGGNQSPSGIKSGEGHEGQQVFCRNASSKRKSEEMWGCCSAGWEFWWQKTWKLPKYSSFKSLLVKLAFRNSSFLHQSEEYLSQGRKIQSGNAKTKQSYGMHGWGEHGSMGSGVIQIHLHLSLKGRGDHGSSQEQKEQMPLLSSRSTERDKEFLGKLMEQLILKIILEHTFSSLNFLEGT